MLDVKNKWVFITGATRGLGRLAAIQMAKLGCNVIVHSRTMEGSQKICDELAQFGVQTKAVACELSDIDAVKAMLKEIDSFGVDVDIVLIKLLELGIDIFDYEIEYPADLFGAAFPVLSRKSIYSQIFDTHIRSRDHDLLH